MTQGFPFTQLLRIREPDEALELGDDGYPFPYSIDDIYKWYGDVTW
jgi:hypothetical protein